MWTFAGEHPLLFFAVVLLVLATFREAVHDICEAIGRRKEKTIVKPVWRGGNSNGGERNI